MKKTDEANNTGLQTKRVGRGEKVRFTYNMPTATDQEIIVYAGYYLKSLGDVSNLQPTSMLIANASRLTEIVCHSPNLINTDLSECTKLQRIDLSDCTALGTGIGAQPILNIQNCKYLRYCNCMNTQLTAIYTMQAGGNLEEIYYPESTQVVQLTNQTYLHTVGIPCGTYTLVNSNTGYIESTPTKFTTDFIRIDNTKTYKFLINYNITNISGRYPYCHVGAYAYDENYNAVTSDNKSFNGNWYEGHTFPEETYNSGNGLDWTFSESTKYVKISFESGNFDGINNLQDITMEQVKRYVLFTDIDNFRKNYSVKNLANVQISNCNAIRYLQYPFNPDDPINFDSLKYVQNLTVINSLRGLNSMQFNGFDKLRNVTLSSLKELESIGFEDMLPVTTTSTLKNITISDCPLITSLSFNVSSDDYQVAFATNGKLDLGGMQSLRTIECNTSVKGLNTLIVPTSLKELKFYPEFGDGLNEIKNIWSASAVHNDGFEGIDFQDMTIEFIDMLGLNAISNAINFHIAPKYQNPNLNTARDGSTDKPWFHPIGSMNLSNYTGSMIGMLRGIDLNKLDVVISTDRDQVDLTSLFECATIPTAQNIVAKTNNILNKFPKSVIWDYMFKGCSLSFSPKDITIPNRGLSLKGMYKDSDVTEDVSLPNVIMAVDEMFMNCTGITTYEENWLKTYSKITYTVPTSNGTSGYWDDNGNYTESTSYNQFLYTPSTGEKAFKIMTTGIGEVRINYFLNNSFLSRKVYIPENDNYPYVVTIPDNCNKIIFVCDTVIGFVSEGNITTKDCYTNTGGDLAEIPATWGGYGFDKNSTSIYVIDTTNLSNTTIFNLVDLDTQVGITDWGDGTINAEKSHTYREHGIYTIKTKSCPNGVAPHDDVKNALIEVKQIKLIGHNGNTQNYSNLFNGCKNLRKVTTYNLAPSDCNSMFIGCSSLTEIVGMDTWDMSSCATCFNMFNSCGLQDYSSIENWNLSSCSDFSCMFMNTKCTGSIDISKWTTVHVGSVFRMFNNSYFTSINVSNIVKSDINGISEMFRGAKASEIIGMDTWDTSNITNWFYAFGGCSNLKELNISNWVFKDADYNVVWIWVSTSFDKIIANNIYASNPSKVAEFLNDPVKGVKCPVKEFIMDEINPNQTNFSGMFEGTSIKNDIIFPSWATNVSNCFKDCTEITHIHSNWKNPYVLSFTPKVLNEKTEMIAVFDVETVRFNSTNAIYLSCLGYDSNKNFIGYYNFANPPLWVSNSINASSNSTFDIQINRDDIKYIQFNNVSSTVTITKTYKPKDALEYTTDCYAGCTGITHCDGVDLGANSYTTGLDEVPTTWGGYGFSKDVTGIYVINIPSDNYAYELGFGRNSKETLTVTNGTVNWGDGTVTNNEVTHTYSKAGTYTIKGHITHSPGLTVSMTPLIEVKQIPLSRTTSYYNKFSGCKNLAKVTIYNYAPTSCNNMFNGCSSLTEIVGMDTWDMSNCDNFETMFSGCSNLINVKLNMEIGANCTSMFRNCTNLERIDVNLKPTVTSNLFRGCVNINYVRSIDFDYTTFDNGEGLGWSTYNTALETFNILGTLSVSLMNIHGFTGLSVEGIMEFIYALKDYSTSEETYTLQIGSTNLAKLTNEQIAIATSKGWTLS